MSRSAQHAHAGGPRGGLAVFQSLASKFMPSYRHFQHLPLAAIRRDFGCELQGWSSHGPLWTSSCAAVKILLHKLRSFFTKWWTSKPPNQQLLSQLLDWPDLHLSTTGDIPPLCVPVSKIDELVFFWRMQYQSCVKQPRGGMVLCVKILHL